MLRPFVEPHTGFLLSIDMERTGHVHRNRLLSLDISHQRLTCRFCALLSQLRVSDGLLRVHQRLKHSRGLDSSLLLHHVYESVRFSGDVRMAEALRLLCLSQPQCARETLVKVVVLILQRGH